MNNKLYQDIVANDLYPNKYYYPFILHIGGVWPNFMMFGQTFPPFIFSLNFIYLKFYHFILKVYLIILI